MKPNELRTAVYDEQLQLESCRFAGIVQPFPNHFHEHHVIGFVEQGAAGALLQKPGVPHPARRYPADRLCRPEPFYQFL